jgi:iron-sulfur cluster repair protein YtfE (RIC family)
MRTVPTFSGTMTVNETLLREPAAIAVLSAYGIDSCCGGPLPLEEAARRHGLDLQQLLAALEAVARD